MKKRCLFFLCLILALALSGCNRQPQVIEHIPANPTGVPGEPTGVPGGEINGGAPSWNG